MDKEDQRVEDIILGEVREVRELVVNLVSRVAKLEGKYTWVAGIYGIIGGALAAISIYLARGG